MAPALRYPVFLPLPVLVVASEPRLPGQISTPERHPHIEVRTKVDDLTRLGAIGERIMSAGGHLLAGDK
jgi:hypothetical protein